MPDAAKKPRRRKLITIETYTTGTGESQKFGAHISLPLSSATVVESENAAVRVMQGANAQLDFVDSDLRLVVYDIKRKRYVKVTIPD